LWPTAGGRRSEGRSHSGCSTKPASAQSAESSREPSPASGTGPTALAGRPTRFSQACLNAAVLIFAEPPNASSIPGVRRPHRVQSGRGRPRSEPAGARASSIPGVRRPHRVQSGRGRPRSEPAGARASSIPGVRRPHRVQSGRGRPRSEPAGARASSIPGVRRPHRVQSGRGRPRSEPAGARASSPASIVRLPHGVPSDRRRPLFARQGRFRAAAGLCRAACQMSATGLRSRAGDGGYDGALNRNV
jgi:hypothetical protein